jgi:two-component system, chemotaxis family, sensor kinase CheA
MSSLAIRSMIFHIMYTIKGSAARVQINCISTLTHSLKDLFFYIRESNPRNINYTKLTDIVLECIDFIKFEINKIENGQDFEGDSTELSMMIKEYLNTLKSLKYFYLARRW